MEGERLWTVLKSSIESGGQKGVIAKRSQNKSAPTCGGEKKSIV